MYSNSLFHMKHASFIPITCAGCVSGGSGISCTGTEGLSAGRNGVELGGDADRLATPWWLGLLGGESWKSNGSKTVDMVASTSSSSFSSWGSVDSFSSVGSDSVVYCVSRRSPLPDWLRRYWTPSSSP